MTGQQTIKISRIIIDSVIGISLTLIAGGVIDITARIRKMEQDNAVFLNKLNSQEQRIDKIEQDYWKKSDHDRFMIYEMDPVYAKREWVIDTFIEKPK